MMSDERSTWRRLVLTQIVLALIFVSFRGGSPVHGQLSLSPRFNISENVRVDELDNQALGQFQRIDELIAAEQIDEALETLDRVTEEHRRKLIAVEPGRFVSLSTYRQVKLAALPPAVLDAYRRRVDPQAEAAYRQAVAEHDARTLERIVRDWFCSTWGDDAALALGELMLEQGNYNAARRYWLSLFESPPPAVESAKFEATRDDTSLTVDDAKLLDKFYTKPTAPPPREAVPIEGEEDASPPTPAIAAKSWYVANRAAWAEMTDAESAALVKLWRSGGVIGSRLAYPGTSLSLADVRARLILVDVLSGDVGSAAEKLAAFRRLHPTAAGKLAGQDGPLAERLTTLVTQARDWPRPKTAGSWSTFAANQHRSGQTAGRLAMPIALSKPTWRVAVGKPLASNIESDRQVIQRQPRIGETWNGILAYHPVTDGKRLFVAHAEGVSAFDASTGRPLWGTPSGDSLTAADALIFRDDGFTLPKTNQWTRGVPRFTLTLHADRLIARVGPPATSLPTESRAVPATARSKIVVLDVSSTGQGRLSVDPIELEDELLAFDGTPVTDGRSLYAVLRRSDVRPEVLVACYDLQTNPPREKWRTSVAAAETPGSGQVYELTHNLLTLDGDTLYFNTNLGAVAALDCANGEVRWLHTYPRVKLGDLRRLADTGHFYRDLTPCLVHQDTVIVAPFDSPTILLLDAATGAVRWSTDAAPDAIHLLGVQGNTLWASGDRLYAIDVRSGQLRGRWPEAVQPDPRGLGRGAIVGDAVLWPARHELFVFAASLPDAAKSLIKKQAPIDWSKLGVTGGNLIWCDGRLIVATERDIFAFVMDIAPNSPSRNR